jgi:hypothetical protein
LRKSAKSLLSLVKQIKELVSFPFMNRDGIPLKRFTSLVSSSACRTVKQITTLHKPSRIAGVFVFTAFAPSGFFRT